MLNAFIFLLTLLVAYILLAPRRGQQPTGGRKQRKVSQPKPDEFAVCTHVIDGDTISCVVAGTVERVRYIGIDAPERGKAGFHAATEANRRMVEGKTVRLESDKEDRDQYGRLLRYVYVGRVFVNRELFRAGKARLMDIAPNLSRISEIAGD